ncbi:uncharacterized protein BXZ73DRAFT_23714, partial [Epithele typhae]|uniref:uncharacterized protein n=1 Tax=Epithele typhae TaxID=378194 RepID=UPI002007C906
TWSRSVNRTVDDSDLAMVYWPPQGLWSVGNTCGGCDINPSNVNISLVHNGTWHDTTQKQDPQVHSISYMFTGSAIYAYNIIANTIKMGLTTTFTNVTFYIDDQLSGSYAHDRDPTASDFLYNVLVFSATNLSNGPHRFEMRSDPQGADSLILFDYLMYTAEDSPIPPIHALDSTSTVPPLTGMRVSDSTTTSSSTASSITVPPSTDIRASDSATASSSTPSESTSKRPVRARGDVGSLAQAPEIPPRTRPALQPLPSPPPVYSPPPDHDADVPCTAYSPTTNFSSTFSGALASVQFVVPSGRPSPSPTRRPLLPAHTRPRRAPPRDDVPAPAVSVSGTEASIRAAEFEQMLSELEEHRRELQLMRKGGGAPRLAVVNAQGNESAATSPRPSSSAPASAQQSASSPRSSRSRPVSTSYAGAVSSSSTPPPGPSAHSFAQINVTIDDDMGDYRTQKKPLYIPSNSWKQGSTCEGCNVRGKALGGEVEENRTINGTWHDTTYHPVPGPTCSIVINFIGTAIYVFNIVLNSASIPGTTIDTELWFILDDIVNPTPYTHNPDPSGPDIMYDVLVFNRTGLLMQEHRLTIELDPLTASLALFDYALYTTDDPSTTPLSFAQSASTISPIIPIFSSSPNPTTAPSSTAPPSSHSPKPSALPIVGAVAGGIAGAVLLSLGLRVLLRNRPTRRRHR